MPTARELLEQADALMRRNRLPEVDDIPVLTDAVTAVPEALLRSPVPPEGIPTLVDVVAPDAMPEAETAVESFEGGEVDEGEPSDWLDFKGEQHSVIGDVPDSIAVIPPVEIRKTIDPALLESAEHEEIDLAPASDNRVDADRGQIDTPEAASEEKAIEEAVEDAQFEEPLVEARAAEEETVEETQVEEPHVDAQVADDETVEDAQFEEPLVEARATEEETVEDTQVEEPLVEAQDVEEETVEDTPVEEPLVEASAAKDEAAEEAFADEPAIEAWTAEDEAIEELRSDASWVEPPASAEVIEAAASVESLDEAQDTEEDANEETPPVDRATLPDSESSPEKAPIELPAAVDILIEAAPPIVASMMAPQMPASAPTASDAASAAAEITSRDEAAKWDGIAEEIRIQVLQRIDLFTDTGLREQLGIRLKPIVDRASADLVATINEHVGELLRSYVAEAIEREIERWRRDH